MYYYFDFTNFKQINYNEIIMIFTMKYNQLIQKIKPIIIKIITLNATTTMLIVNWK